MIQKVKPPAALKLVHSSGQTKNDLGGQSGNAYQQNPPSAEESQSQRNDAGNGNGASELGLKDTENPSSSAVPVTEQVGLTHVVKEWLSEKHAPASNPSASKVSEKYLGASSPAKGMLLNRKLS